MEYKSYENLTNLAATLNNLLDCNLKEIRDFRKELQTENDNYTFSLALFNTDAYRIFEQFHAPICYLQHNWFKSIKGNANYTFLRKLIDKLKSSYVQPQGPRITRNSIQEIMSHLENEFGFAKNLLQGRTINLLIFDNSHKELNSECSTKIDTDGNLHFDLYLYHMKDKGISPEYVFLHELGHVVHTILTGSCYKVPADFIELLRLLLPGFVPEKGQLIEIFADFFAMCTMCDSCYTDHNYIFSSVPENHKAIIRVYMQAVIKQYPVCSAKTNASVLDAIHDT